MYTAEELRQARRQVASIISKCEKVLAGQRPGSPQHTLLTRRLQAMRISLELLNKEAEGPGDGARAEDAGQH